VDDGFWYSIPPTHQPRIQIGSLVRVPLGGRRVRGYVVEIGERPPERLKPIAGISGRMPVFDRPLRDALVWAAHYYVAPVAVMLERAAPPNLPAQPPASLPAQPPANLPTPPPADPPSGTGRTHPKGEKAGLDGLIESVLADRRRPPIALLATWEDMSWLEQLALLVEAGRSVLVIAATASEVDLIARQARNVTDRVIEVNGELDDAVITERWSLAAATPGHLVVGTPRCAAWPVTGLGVVAVVEEGRRAMKDRQTPTVAVRTILMTRARLEGFAQIYIGPTPSLELLAGGAEIVTESPRAWPLVEVVDRNEEPPGSGLVSGRVRAALDGLSRRNGSAFVFTHRRGYAPSFRCASCRELRLCPTCGSRPEPGAACSRCGTPSAPCQHCGGTSFEPLGAGVERVRLELEGLFGGAVGDVGSGRPMMVGTERDLAALKGVDLAVAVDADGLIHGSHFRAGEEALRLLARVAGRVRRGRGNRMMVQTSQPDHPLIVAMRRGDPLAYLEHEMSERRRLGYPPAADLLVVEIRGEVGRVDEDLREAADADVDIMGPAVTFDAHRWLIQGPGLGGYKLALRPLVQRWRDSGSTVRIDVDPLDL
jgi:primosomal protein N' (replication factor Y) (superfamily II helicase)